MTVKEWGIGTTLCPTRSLKCVDSQERRFYDRGKSKRLRYEGIPRTERQTEKIWGNDIGEWKMSRNPGL